MYDPMKVLTAAIACTATTFTMLGDAYCGAIMGGWEIVHEWGGHGSGPGQFDTPSDIGVGFTGEVYVADSDNHRIQVFDSAGNFLREWPAGEVTQEVTGIDIDGLYVYVVPFRQCVVERYSSIGILLGEWGSCDGVGGLEGLRDVGVRGGFVFGMANHLQRYTVMGDYVNTVESFNSAGITSAPDGTLWVYDETNSLRQYSSDGMLLRQWFLFPPEEFHQFEGIAVGTGGSVYVSEVIDISTSSIHEFTMDGELLSTTVFSFRLLGDLAALGADTLFARSILPGDRIVKLARRQVVPVERTTWGQIKSKYSSQSLGDE